MIIQIYKYINIYIDIVTLLFILLKKLRMTKSKDLWHFKANFCEVNQHIIACVHLYFIYLYEHIILYVFSIICKDLYISIIVTLLLALICFFPQYLLSIYTFLKFHLHCWAIQFSLSIFYILNNAQTYLKIYL